MTRDLLFKYPLPKYLMITRPQRSRVCKIWSRSLNNLSPHRCS